MTDFSPSNSITDASETGAVPATVVEITPNQELAIRVTAALIQAGLLPETYLEQCETLIADGKATGTSWTKFLEKPVDSSTSSSDSHA